MENIKKSLQNLYIYAQSTEGDVWSNISEDYEKVKEALEILSILTDSCEVETMDTKTDTYETINCYLDNRKMFGKVKEFNKVKDWLEKKPKED